MGNDISISVRVSDQSGSGLAGVTTALRNLKDKAHDTNKAITKLRASMASGLTATAKLDDQTGSGAAAVKSAIADLKRLSPMKLVAELDDQTGPAADGVKTSVAQLQSLGPVKIKATVDDDTSSGLSSVRASVAALAALSPVELDIALNDRTAAGLASVQTAVTRIKALSPIELDARLNDGTGPGVTAVKAALTSLRASSPVRLEANFTGSTGEITAAATAMQSLKTSAGAAGTALGNLTPKATAAAAALELLKNAAQEASNALRTLRGRAAAAAAAMAELRASTMLASNALRSFNTRAAAADGRLGDLSTRSRALRGDMDDLDGSLTRVTGHMGALRGSLGTLGSSTGSAGNSTRGLMMAAIALAPALIPIAAATVPIAGATLAAAAGVTAFALALGPQAKAMADASKASTEYTTALREHGTGSKEALTAEKAMTDSMKKLPPATREAAAALSLVKEEYVDWGKALAADTMPVAVKSFSMFTGLFEGLTPVVKASSVELDRMMTVLAGGTQTKGFEQFMDKLANWSGGALRSATNGIVSFSRALSTGTGSGPISEFMEYARVNGPLVGETLRNLGQALGRLISAASEVGVGMLTVVNAFAALIANTPTEVITTLLQMVIAFKAVTLAAAGMAAVGTVLAAVRAQAVLAGTAAIGASGGVGMLTAAFMALSRGAKIAVAATGIGLLAVALIKLSSIGNDAPPNVDKLSSSLAKLGQTGKASGEASRVFGKDLDGLYKSVRSLTDPSTADGVQQFLVGWSGFDSTPVKEAKENFNAIDDALTDLVRGGKSDLAAAALERLKASYKKGGGDVKDFTGKLNDYKDALADAKFEQELAAEAQGLFGAQAQKTQEKLNAQKASADGLRQSIQALNDVNRAASGAMNAFEAAIDAGMKVATENAGGLKGAFDKVTGTLDLNSEGARKNEAALRELGATTDAATAAARDNGAGWEAVQATYERGRANFMKMAQTMGLTKTEANQLADVMLKMPDKEVFFKGRIEDLDGKIKTAQAKVDALKQKSPAQLRANGGQLAKEKAAAQKRLDSLKQKRAAAIKASNQTGPGVSAAKRSIDSVRGKTVSVMVQYRASHSSASAFAKSIGGFAHGGVVGAAGGGPRSRFTLVGEQGPEMVDLAPGSRVRSNPDTKRMLTGGHATAGGASQPMVVHLHVGGKEIAQVLIDPLRKEIRTQGGNVQAVLGQRGSS